MSSALKSLFLLIESDVLGLGEFATRLFSCSLFRATILVDWVCLDVLLVVDEARCCLITLLKNEELLLKPVVNQPYLDVH